MLDGFRLRCPVCRRGRLFDPGFTYTMRQRCSECGVVFEPDPGEVTGGMAINMVLTSILGLAAVFYGAFFSKLPTPTFALLLVIVPSLFALWFHRHARGLWVGALYVTGSMFEKQAAARVTRRPATRPPAPADSRPKTPTGPPA